MPRARSGERRQEILETLARMLVELPGENITTAKLARAVGVSEAALYRHFPSKAKMFEALIEFIEESIFTRVTRILADDARPGARVQQIMTLVLGFADRNPGMARILYGDALVGETERLRQRVAQIYDRIETQFKQILREADPTGFPAYPVAETATLLLAFVEGRIAHFVRGGFRDSPLEGWDKQWEMFKAGFRPLAQ